jgi:hypothetical protein
MVRERWPAAKRPGKGEARIVLTVDGKRVNRVIVVIQ